MLLPGERQLWYSFTVSHIIPTETRGERYMCVNVQTSSRFLGTLSDCRTAQRIWLRLGLALRPTSWSWRKATSSEAILERQQYVRC